MLLLIFATHYQQNSIFYSFYALLPKLKKVKLFIQNSNSKPLSHSLCCDISKQIVPNKRTGMGWYRSTHTHTHINCNISQFQRTTSHFHSSTEKTENPNWMVIQNSFISRFFRFFFHVVLNVDIDNLQLKLQDESHAGVSRLSITFAVCKWLLNTMKIIVIAWEIVEKWAWATTIQANEVAFMKSSVNLNISMWNVPQINKTFNVLLWGIFSDGFSVTQIF